MNTRNLKLGYVAVTLLTGSTATAYIRDYELVNGTPCARTRVNGEFITATWNGTNWAEVVPISERGQLNGDRAWSLLK